MKLLDYNTVTVKDIFLLNLYGEDIGFSEVPNDDMPIFFHMCMQLNLLKFIHQKEYRGTLATFKIIKPFRFYLYLERTHGLGHGRTKVKLLSRDIIKVTEILMAHDYYREPVGDNKSYSHVLFFDFPRELRKKSYENFNYEM